MGQAQRGRTTCNRGKAQSFHCYTAAQLCGVSVTPGSRTVVTQHTNTMPLCQSNTGSATEVDIKFYLALQWKLVTSAQSTY